MNNIYNKLKDIISDKAQIDFDEKNHCVIIEEPINIKKEQLQSVNFKLCTGRNKKYNFYFAFKLDDNEANFLGKLFKSNLPNIRKAVDAIIICEYNKVKYIFLIELKSNNRRGFIDKFKSSTLFLNFLTDYLKVYHNLDLSGFIVKSVVFDRKVNKGKPNLSTIHNYTFYHQGFSKQKNNEADIRNFIR